MSGFSKFLALRLTGRGSQIKLARALGANPGTVNKWLSGEHVPNFESSLRLADYFNVEATHILQLTGNLAHYRLYMRLFKQADFQTELHRRLQKLLDHGHTAKVEAALLRLERNVDSRRAKVSGRGKASRPTGG